MIAMLVDRISQWYGYSLWVCEIYAMDSFYVFVLQAAARKTHGRKLTGSSN